MKTRLAVVLGTLLGMASCGLDVEGMKETNPDGGTPLELTVSASDGTIVLNERKSEETALGLSWTTGSNYGTGNAIEYILDIDLADGDWDGCYTENLGRRVYSRDITVEELNTILIDELETVPGSEAGFKVRVTASVVDCPDLVQTSEAKCSATTYRPVSMSLFMTTGGAGAWNASENIEMTRSSAGIFTAARQKPSLMHVSSYSILQTGMHGLPMSGTIRQTTERGHSMPYTARLPRQGQTICSASGRNHSTASR